MVPLLLTHPVPIVGLATFFFGFGAGAALNLYFIKVKSPLIAEHRGSLNYVSSIVGDGLVLPLVREHGDRIGAHRPPHADRRHHAGRSRWSRHRGHDLFPRCPGSARLGELDHADAMALEPARCLPCGIHVRGSEPAGPVLRGCGRRRPRARAGTGTQCSIRDGGRPYLLRAAAPGLFHGQPARACPAEPPTALPSAIALGRRGITPALAARIARPTRTTSTR